MKNAENCENIQEIRNEIDGIDQQILELFKLRLDYVSEIVKFKSDADEIIALERQLEVFGQRREWAEQLGLNPDLIENIYRTLINWNLQKEMEIYNNTENSETLKTL